MKKIYFFALTALMAGASATGFAATNHAARFFKDAQTMTALNPNGFLRQMPEKKAAHNYAVTAKTAGDNTPDATMTDFAGWGYLNATDGTSWLFTQTYTIGDNGFYSGSKVTVYDSKNEKQAEVNIEIPDTIKVNSIEPYGTITTNFFDRDKKTWEFMVYLHVIGENYNNSGLIRAYNNSGELVQEYEADNALFFDATEGWTNYQRVILLNEDTVDGVEVTKLDVMKPCGWSDAPSVEHTFTVNSSSIVYSPGSYFNMFKVEGKPYYVVSYFEKDYFEDETAEDPVATADNHYLLDVYDKNYKKVKTVSVPVSPDTGALYDFPSFGSFTDSEDMSLGMFSNDGKFNFIVAHVNYVVSSDANTYTIKVYNEDSEEVATIEQGVSSWLKLSDIPGQEQQYGFLVTNASAESIEMVDIPSCLTVATFPATVDDAQLSTNFDRYAVGDSYQYVFGIGTGYTDKDGNVISRIGWYNTDVTLDHYVKINNGPNCEYFLPNINGTTLNPYLFNTDEQHEYIFLAKIKQDDSEVIDTKLMVANDEGEILRTYEGDTEGKGDIRLVTVFEHKLLIAYYNYTTKNYAFDVFNLPFEKFEAGGDGTEANPYKIKTRGDFELIADDPDAYYEVVADIEMGGSYWTPISQFNGHLDGNGHVIKNLAIDSEATSLGLFASTIGAIDGEGNQTNVEVKNLIFDSPSISAGSNCNYVGVVTATAMATTFENIHIYNAIIDGGEADAMIGGIVGDASLISPIKSCSFEGTIDAPKGEKVGGIAGRMLTSTTVEACKTSGSYTAAVELGGIAGSTDNNGSAITNSASTATLKAQNSIGGIVGTGGRSAIERCYFNGTIEATEASMWDGFAVGGIVGYLNADWSTAQNTLIQNNYAANPTFTLPAGATVKTVHRIVGYSRIDEGGKAEACLANNYANAEAATYGVDKALTSTEGADKAISEADKAFFESLSFAYGGSVESPWKGETGIPVLYYEDAVNAITLTASAKKVIVESSIELTAEVFGIDSAEGVTFSVSDPEVAALSDPEVDGSIADVTLTGLKEGEVVVTATAGDFSASVTITVEYDASVAAISDSALAVRYANGLVSAPGASEIRVYNAAGAMVASAKAESVKVAANGLMIAVATDAAGHRAVAKFIAK